MAIINILERNWDFFLFCRNHFIDEESFPYRRSEVEAWKRLLRAGLWGGRGREA
jgi:hypothetical protein